MTNLKQSSFSFDIYVKSLITVRKSFTTLVPVEKPWGDITWAAFKCPIVTPTLTLFATDVTPIGSPDFGPNDKLKSLCGVVY